MKSKFVVAVVGLLAVAVSSFVLFAADNDPFTDFHGEAPGKIHHITAADLPKPFATQGVANFAQVVPRPADAMLKTLPGFKVNLYIDGLNNPRLITTAPNGDLFVAASTPGEILVFHGLTADGKAESKQTFATGLHLPFGIAFYPPGPNPQYLYVGNSDATF